MSQDAHTPLGKTEKHTELPPFQAPAQTENRGRKKAVSIAADVDVQESSSSTRSESSTAEEEKTAKEPNPILIWLNGQFGWVRQNFTRPKLIPVFRCALVAWLDLVLFVIPPVQEQLGQSSFIMLIISVISMPVDPFISVFEREFLLILFSCIAWAWCCLAIFLADLARKVHDPNVTIVEALNGDYIEAAPTVILAVFIFLGCAFFLFIKARQGPGPFLFAAAFGFISIDASLTTSVLLPYPMYKIGKTVAVPLAIHSALAMLASLIIFPSSISSLFVGRLNDVVSPLLTTLCLHERLLATRLTSSSFAETLSALRVQTKGSEAKLVPLAAAARLIKSDLIYSRFSPGDYTVFQAIMRKLTARADGMGMYFGLIDPNRERVPGIGDKSTGVTPFPTVPPTPNTHQSRLPSRDRSPERDFELAPMNHGTSTHSGPEHIGTPSAIIHNPIDSPPSPSSHHSSESHAVVRPSLNQTPTTSHSRQLQSHHHPHFNIFPKSTPFDKHGSRTPSRSHAGSHAPHQHGHLHHDLLHQSLLSLTKARSKRQENTVGTFETQRYLNLEFTRFHDSNEQYYSSTLMDLLRECCTPLLNASHLGLSEVSNWFSNASSGRFSYFRNSVLLAILGPSFGKRARISLERQGTAYRDRMRELHKVKDEVERARKVFREETRHLILEPYKTIFGEDPHDLDGHNDPSLPRVLEQDQTKKAPAHRYLFHCYLYQYHLLHFAGDVIELLDEILKLENKRPWPNCRLWIPAPKIFKWNTSLVSDASEQTEIDDDDPNIIQGVQDDADSLPQSSASGGQPTSSSSQTDLGLPRRRDPDALPPRNTLEWILNTLHQFLAGLGGGNAIFALKAGVLTILLCLPALLKSSARFAYENHFVWMIWVAQLTIARFHGDTIFALMIRVICTFSGCVLGMVMWYTSTGLGHGNAYGLAAVCAVCYPFIFFARLYWPIKPYANLILFITTMVYVGYAYRDGLFEIPGAPGRGYNIAWRRFVLATAGVVAAFLVSLLPPSTTLRRYQRHLLATTTSELGLLYCSVLSYANTKEEDDRHGVLASLIAVRNKLKRSTDLRANVKYEFSLRGRWPVDRYQKIAELEMAITYSLSHLISVVKHLEPSWALAFLRRTRFLDPDFQGDLLAVISMLASSLRTGCPLPQITPCPLLDRFTLQYHGLNVIHKEAEEDYGLPRTLTLDTLKNEQYLIFCVGVATAYSIVNRLDMLMIAVKELVGEQYHIQGVRPHPYQHSQLPLIPALNVGVSGLPNPQDLQESLPGDGTPSKQGV